MESKVRKKREGRNQVDTYYFDVEKFKKGCYKEGAINKTYSVSIKSNEHVE